MPSGRQIPFVAPEPRLIVAGHDQDVGRVPVSGQVAVVVDVLGREQGRDIGRLQGARLGDLGSGRGTGDASRGR